MTKVNEFDMSAPREAKKLDNIEDGKYVFSVRGTYLYVDPSTDDKIIFVNTSTDEASGRCPSLRFNVSTESGNAYLDDFLATLVKEGTIIPLTEIDGLQFIGNKVTTEDGYHNITGWSSVKEAEEA